MKVCLYCTTRFASADWCCPQCGYTPLIRDDIRLFAPDLAHENDGMHSESFANLASLEAHHFWFRSRNELIAWMIQRFCPDAKNLLEIGCGTGFVLLGVQSKHPQLTLSGSELHQAGLAFARKRLPDVTLFQMDARHIPFEAEFDVIGAFDVLEHITEDEAVLGQMFQAIRPGGSIIVTVPQHRFLWTVIDDYSMHKRRYSRAEMICRLTAAGFCVKHVTSFMSFLLPIMLLSRLRNRHVKVDDVDPTSELRIGQHLNKLFERVLTLERRLIQAGVSFPVGGSLLVVAYKPEE
jgi:ubiquinone/menaquinone biosynthesis C-methylase UbiE